LQFDIIEVTNKNLLKKFIKFPKSLYSSNPFFVPHLFLERALFFNEKLNPFFKTSDVKHFLAIDKSQNILGRISGVINHTHNNFHNENVGFFGNFESINNPEVSRELFDKVKQFLKSKNINIIRGPVNLSTNHECGLLIDKFDESPSVMMPYNFEYYINLIENYGFYKAKDLLAVYIDAAKIDIQRLRKASNIIEKRYNIRVREVNFSKFNSELDIIYNIYNSAWEKNWGFVPMDKEEFLFSASTLKYIAYKDLILIAEVDKNPIGFIIGLPNINIILKKMDGKILPFGIFRFLSERNKLNDLRVITLGVVKEYRNKAIDYLLISKITENGVNKRGVRGAECSWILEDNYAMINGLLKLCGNISKRYRIYEFKES